MIADCGYRPFGRSDRGEALASECSCPAGTAAGHGGVSGDAPTREGVSIGGLPAHVVTRHGTGEVRTGEAPGRPVLRSSEGGPGSN